MGVPKRNIRDDELVELYHSKASITWLAQYYNCHPATIRRHLLKCGVELRPHGRKLQFLSKDDLEQMIHNERMSDGQIACKYGVTPTTVRKLRLRYGIASHPFHAGRGAGGRAKRYGTRPPQQQQEASDGKR
ncbi:MAG: hypothetical protein OHK0022_29810 [Roseiflexaceae bacterium]